MKIEKAKTDDHLILSEIAYQGKAFWGYEAEQLEKWKEDLTISKQYIENNETYKLVVNGTIIGFFSLLNIENDILKLDHLFMYPKYIGQGYGQILLKQCIETAKDMKAKKIILDADPNAEKFYGRFGFKMYNQLESSIKNRFLPQMELTIA